MRSRYSLAVVLTLAVTLAFTPESAIAWNNGPDGTNSFGTHDWVVREAAGIAAKYGVTWVNVNVAMAASDDPDTIFGDQVHHNYDVTPPDYYGSSPDMVEYHYYRAVDSLRAGNATTASYHLGLLSHYLSDTWNPLHTDGAAGANEDAMHAPFEAAVEGQIIPSAWGMDYGFVYVTDPYGLACRAASSANSNYPRTVYDYHAYGLAPNSGAWMSAQVSLAMAVHDLQRVIRSIQADAAVDPTPNAIHRFYRPESGTHFYTASYTEAINVVCLYSKDYRYEGVSYVANPATNTRPLHRFYNQRMGTHLYIADDGEKAGIIANLSGTYAYEGIAYRVSFDGGTLVHRFYSPSKGAHFYSADPNEIAYVQANLGSIWQYEGPTYCVAQ